MAPMLPSRLPFFFPCGQQCAPIWHGGTEGPGLTARACIPSPVSCYDHLHLLRAWLLAVHLDLGPSGEPWYHFDPGMLP